MPIVLAVSEDDKVRLENNKAIVLRYKGVAKAILRLLSSPNMSHDVRTIYLQEPRFLPSSKRGEMCKAVWNYQSRTPLHQGRPTREIFSCKTNIP